MKIKLLCNGGYGGMENVNFPVVVESTLSGSELHGVTGRELISLGANPDWFSPDILYNFNIDECEAIKNEN